MKGVYKYKDHSYKLIGEIKVKNQQTRLWENHVLYQNLIGELFSRETVEFFERFKLDHTDTDLFDNLVKQVQEIMKPKKD